jgi:hypothetical protein
MDSYPVGTNACSDWTSAHLAPGHRGEHGFVPGGDNTVANADSYPAGTNVCLERPEWETSANLAPGRTRARTRRGQTSVRTERNGRPLPGSGPPGRTRIRTRRDKPLLGSAGMGDLRKPGSGPPGRTRARTRRGQTSVRTERNGRPLPGSGLPPPGSAEPVPRNTRSFARYRLHSGVPRNQPGTEESPGNHRPVVDQLSRSVGIPGALPGTASIPAYTPEPARYRGISR